MSAATIIRDPRDNFLSYCERYNDILREASVGYNETGFAFGFLGFTFGLNRRITLYENTLVGWSWPNKEMPLLTKINNVF